MKPTVARTVHYTSPATPGADIPVPRAAIITAVHSDEDVALAVISPTGMYFRLDVPYSPEPKPGHWNWPPREPASERGKHGGGRISGGGVIPVHAPSEGSINVTLSPGHNPNVVGTIGAALAQMDARSYLK